MYYTEIQECGYEGKGYDLEIPTTWENWIDSCIGFDSISALKSEYPAIATQIEDFDCVEDMEQLMSESTNKEQQEHIEDCLSEYYDYCRRTGQN